MLLLYFAFLQVLGVGLLPHLFGGAFTGGDALVVLIAWLVGNLGSASAAVQAPGVWRNPPWCVQCGCLPYRWPRFVQVPSLRRCPPWRVLCGDLPVRR